MHITKHEKLTDKQLETALETAATSRAGGTRHSAQQQTKNSTSRKADKVMKMKNTVSDAIIAVTQSKWIRPALMTLVILANVLFVTGCSPHH